MTSPKTRAEAKTATDELGFELEGFEELEGTDLAQAQEQNKISSLVQLKQLCVAHPWWDLSEHVE